MTNEKRILQAHFPGHIHHAFKRKLGTLAIETGLRILGIVPDKILTGSIFHALFLKVPAINGIKFFRQAEILERIKKTNPRGFQNI